MFSKVFQFGKTISHTTLFSDEQGYGFVNQEHLLGKTKSEQSLYSGGWNLRSSAKEEWKQSLATVSDGVQIQSERFAMIFKILVPQEGTYRITVKATAGAEGIQNMMLFANRRNLIERDIQIAPNQTYTKSFFTDVTPYIPAMTSIPCTEKVIYISAVGKNAKFTEISVEEAIAPVLFIAGDSTLTDQNAPFPYYPYGSCGGWAQVISQYFDKIAVCNQAHSGMTTNCFRDDGHWDIVKDRIKENDIFMIQFGHNDQKRRNLSAFGGYITNLRWYVKEIQKRGAIPIIVSPISRIPLEDNGDYYSLLSAHAAACRMAAEECKVPFIDLHTLTFQKWCSIGEEKTHDYFMPGDITHTNDYGANLIAGFVISEIIKQAISPLSDFVLSFKKQSFLPDRNNQPEEFQLPQEPAEGNMFNIDIPYLDIKGIPQYKDMIKALQMGLLDPCVMYLHPTESMPRAQFLMIYFKALRIAGKRPYLGRFCDLSKYEWDSSYVQTCIEENLIDPTTTPNDRFRPDDPLTQAEYASFLIRGMAKTAKEREISLEDAFSKAIELGFLPNNAAANQIITRADCYKGLVRLMELLDNADLALPEDAEIHPVG